MTDTSENIGLTVRGLAGGVGGTGLLCIAGRFFMERNEILFRGVEGLKTFYVISFMNMTGRLIQSGAVGEIIGQRLQYLLETIGKTNSKDLALLTGSAFIGAGVIIGGMSLLVQKIGKNRIEVAE